MENLGDFIFGSQESGVDSSGFPLLSSTALTNLPTQGNEGGVGSSQTIQDTQEENAQRLLTSEIFTKHFRKGDLKNNKYEVFCNYCPTKYSWAKGGGYGTLRKHMETKHKEKIGMIQCQTQLVGYGMGNPSLNPNLFYYNHDASAYALVESICVDHLTFQFSENVGFNDWAKNYAQPTFKPIYRKIIKSKVMLAYKNKKRVLVEIYAKNDICVSICSDIWSDHGQVHSYTGLTCRFIDDRFNIQKRVLAYRVFDDVHNASNICVMIH